MSKTPVKEFTVIKSKWSGMYSERWRVPGADPGPNAPKSQLLNDVGDMCCLGFLAEASGFSEEDLLGQSMPGYNSRVIVHQCPFLSERDNQSSDLASIQAYEAAEINDSTLSIDKKIEQLTALFAANGIKINFVETQEDDLVTNV